MIQQRDSLVIFDEGHNIEDIACEGSSYSIKLGTVEEVKKILS